MAALQRVPQPTVTTAVSSCAPSCGTGIGPSSVVGGEKETAPDQFPVGLRVLVVDDDVTCLRIVEQMLRRCLYNVATCSKATVALQLLREKKNYFDVVLSDVHMPDIDGYKLLELVGLEMDLPVIMMSADGTTSAVMKGIRHGACDYLIKPIRAEELKNLWQHVVRKKCNGNKEFEPAGNFDDNDRHRRSNDDIEFASSVNEDEEGLKGSKKRSSSNNNNNNDNNYNNNNNNNNNFKEEDESEPDNDDPSSSKKPRVVWSVELHQQFVSAVNQLGLDKAVPKRILELMNVPGLTRENVASHLQKFRLYLKRLSVGGLQLQSGFSNTFCGSMEPNVKLGGSVGRFDIQSLTASGQIPPQTLAVLHSEFLGRPAGNLGPTMDPPALLHASILGPKRVEHDLVFSPGLVCQPNIFKQFGPPFISVEDASRYGPWTGNNVGPSNPNGGFSSQNNNLLMDMLHQQKQLQQPQQKQAMVPEPSRSINVQPSCLVVPSQSSTCFNACSPPVNQNFSFNRSPAVDYNTMLSPQSNIPALNGVSKGENKTAGSLCGPFSAPGSTSILTSCSLNGENNACVPNLVNARLQNPTLSVNACVPNLVGIQGLFGANPGELLDQGLLRNLGCVSKGTFVPSRYALDEYESPTRNLTHQKLHSDNGAIPVKQEPNTEFMDNGSSVLPQFPSNDLMSVFTK